MTTEREEAEDAEPKKKTSLLMPLLAGVVVATLLGGAGFFAVMKGFVGTGGADAQEQVTVDRPAFVPIDPLVISLGEDGSRHLRFQAQLEVVPEKRDDVIAFLPRITDVMNGYLRAIDIGEIKDPAMLVRTRAQMLRRVQIIVGDGMVTDLLIMEFVLS